MTIKDVTILIIILLLFWSGIVIANISAGDNFIFQCENGCDLTEEVLGFFRYGQSQIYTITVNSAGSFSIDQEGVYKFKIDNSGNVNWVGDLAEGDFDLKAVLASTDCSIGSFAYGIDSDGLRCVDDCDGECEGLTYVEGDLVCGYITGDTPCADYPCTTCNGASTVCVPKPEGTDDDKCPACTVCNASGSCVAIANGLQDTSGDHQCNGFCQGCYGGACISAAGDDPGNDCATSTTSALGCGQGYCNASSTCQYYNTQERNCPTCYTCNGATSSACVAVGGQSQDLEGSNTCSDVCQECNGSGSCISQNGTDRHNGCSLVGCYTGLCNGNTNPLLACAYVTSGEGNCGACKTCDASFTPEVDGDCAVQYTDGQRDTTGATTCTGTCAACYGGECGFAPTDEDPANQCGTDDCYTGYCNGAGGCDAYSDGGQHKCPKCYWCSDADTGCEYLPANYPDVSCGQCDVCNGTGSCIGATTHWGAQLYGCTGGNQRCYSGYCGTCVDTTANDYRTTYFSNDNCDDCADQGGNVCWRTSLGVAGTQSCTEVCASYGGVVNANWNDNTGCSVQNYILSSYATGGQGCGGDCAASNVNHEGYNSDLPAGAPDMEIYASGEICRYRASGVSLNVSAEDTTGVNPLCHRICVCQW